MNIGGVARHVGSVPHSDWVTKLFAVGEMELYHLNPPLCGYSVVAVIQKIWAMRAQALHLQIDNDQKLPGSADGRNVARTLAAIGYTIL